MDLGPDGQDDFLMPRAQARAAFRTHYVLVASRLLFVFSHGVLVITSSLYLRQGWQVSVQGESSWWLMFLPVWLGDTLCCMLVVYSWFASCPYIQLCLTERQARLGYSNPSILTDILPEIVMAILGLIFIMLALIGEILLCRYLSNLSRGGSGRVGDDSIVPAAIVLLLVALLGTCHGVCIRTDGDFFNALGFGALATFIAALCVPGGLAGSCSWVILVPAPLSSFGVLIAAIRSAKSCGDTLRPEERYLRTAEQFILVVVFVSFIGLICLLASKADTYQSAGAGAVAGAGICIIAVLRAWMARAECRQTSARDPVLSTAAPGIEEGCSE